MPGIKVSCYNAIGWWFEVEQEFCCVALWLGWRAVDVN
jgi:hypothetical protein